MSSKLTTEKAMIAVEAAVLDKTFWQVVPKQNLKTGVVTLIFFNVFGYEIARTSTKQIIGKRYKPQKRKPEVKA